MMIQSESLLSLKLLRGERTELEQLQRILESAPRYSQLVTGSPAGPADAQSMLSILPPGKTYEDKFVYGIGLGERMVGCADVILGYPDAGTAHIGLLLIDEALQGHGYGRAAHDLIAAEVMSWNKYSTLRIGVVRTNCAALGFWHRLGYVETGEVKPYRYAGIQSETIVLQRRLTFST